MVDSTKEEHESSASARRTRTRAARWLLTGATAALMLAAGAAPAQVEVSGAWVRATVAAQKTSAAYMTITARDAVRLIGAGSPVAGSAEIHETRIENEIARMRPAGPITLAPGRSVVLKPGGYHVMLLDLKRPLRTGESVPITLRLEAAGGTAVQVEVQARVATSAPGVRAPADHAGHGH